MCARWTVFNTPLTHVICPKGDSVGRLKGSLLCTAQDGTIAVLDIDGFQLYAQFRTRLQPSLIQQSLPYSMYLIPTSMSPLVRVRIGGDNLLLIYADRHARLWDVKTQEFRRAMTVDKADELVGQGSWAEWYVTPYRVHPLSQRSSQVSQQSPGRVPCTFWSRYVSGHPLFRCVTVGGIP